MNFEDYQDRAELTSGLKDAALEYRLLVDLVALAGEVGELCNMLKKAIAHGHGIDALAVAEELGDPLWYLADIASALGISFDKVAEMNVAKLQRRYPEGFSEERSKRRDKDAEGDAIEQVWEKS